VITSKKQAPVKIKSSLRGIIARGVLGKC
jgi:hypothetical protein